jgi:hypothetical protein
VFTEKGATIIPAARPVRNRLPKNSPVDNEKFLMGRAAEVSNGVKIIEVK